jgi:hypothetical protein
MSYNENLFEHNLKYKRELRELKKERITLTRTSEKDDTIHGHLSIHSDNGNATYLNTIENRTKKIDKGTYNLYREHSPKFDKWLWSIDVDDRTGIRIHPANHGKELKGCVAVGLYKYDNYIAESKKACEILDRVLKKDRKYKITIK